MIDVNSLEARIVNAKRFLNAEMTHLRTRDGLASFTLTEVGYFKDTIHEVERGGIRHLSDIDFIKIQRVLTSVEARMRLGMN